MEDSLIVAKLTLMLLRASVAHPDSLPRDFRVVIAPERDVLSQQEAMEQLSSYRGGDAYEVSGQVSGGNLFVSIERASPADQTRLEMSGKQIANALREMNKASISGALVRVENFEESLLVSLEDVCRWLSTVDCARCAMSGSAPSGKNPTEIAVLWLGHRG